MKLEWLYEARAEYRDLLNWYRVKVSREAARRFSTRILSSVRLLRDFPEMGVLREEGLLGKHGFRALFIDQYVCIYRIDGDTVFIYHLADARTNYLYRLFGFDTQ